MEIIDTHAHVYSEDLARYPLMPDPYLPPPGTGTAAHLRREMERNGVGRVVLVHTFTAYRWDNRLLADSTRELGEAATGVCALNPDDPASPDLLEDYFRNYGVRGLRVFPVGTGPEQTGPRSFELPGHHRLWESCARLGMVVCALIHAGEIETLKGYLRRYPKLPVVLDHCANLAAADAPDGENLHAVLSLAQFPNVFPKVTFVATGSKQPYPFGDTLPLAGRIIQEFGAGRCIWGSDFPTELWIPNTDYAGHLRLFTEELGLSAAEQAELLGGTARHLWFPTLPAT